MLGRGDRDTWARSPWHSHLQAHVNPLGSPTHVLLETKSCRVAIFICVGTCACFARLARTPPTRLSLRTAFTRWLTLAEECNYTWQWLHAGVQHIAVNQLYAEQMTTNGSCKPAGNKVANPNNKLTSVQRALLVSGGEHIWGCAARCAMMSLQAT